MSNDFIKIVQCYHLEELKSRVHKIHSMENHSSKVYIKRDDELSFSASGSKVRKISSIIPFLLQKKPHLLGLIGSSLSHFILAMAQRCLENKIPFVCYLKRSHKTQISGNALLLNLLQPQIHWIDNDHWDQVEEIAGLECDVVIPEGGFILEGVPGSATLGADILRNEIESSLSFDHIIVDAGSGLTAISLILFLGVKAPSKIIHVVSCADSKEVFAKKLLLISQQMAERRLLDSIPSFQYQFYHPCYGKSFGSTPSTIFSYIRSFAQTEGVFLDPLYSAKLFLTFEKEISKRISGHILIIHSGGGSSLFGFTESLRAKDVSSNTRGHSHT